MLEGQMKGFRGGKKFGKKSSELSSTKGGDKMRSPLIDEVQA